MVDDRHNGGSKNVIGRKTKIVGNPIVGDKSGNKIKRVNNTTVNINNTVNVNVNKLCYDHDYLSYCFVAVVVIILLMCLSYCFVVLVVAVVVILLVYDQRQSHHRPQQRQQNHHGEYREDKNTVS